MHFNNYVLLSLLLFHHVPTPTVTSYNNLILKKNVLKHFKFILKIFVFNSQGGNINYKVHRLLDIVYYKTYYIC